MKTFKTFLVFVLALFLINNNSKAQNSNGIIILIGSQNFQFYVQTITPMDGITRTITDEFFVKITKDSIVGELPYFGEGSGASTDRSDAEIKINSKKFEYNITPKKRRWEINIRLIDNGDVRKLFFTVFDNWSTSLMVTSDSKQAVSYAGGIKSN